MKKVFIVALTLFCVRTAEAQSPQLPASVQKMPTMEQAKTLAETKRLGAAVAGGARKMQNGIRYWGGQIMGAGERGENPVLQLRAVFYGYQKGDPVIEGIVQGVADISGSPYAQVGRAYYDLKGPNLAGRNMGLFDRPTVHIDPGSKGTHLTEWNIFELLAEEAIREKAAGTNIAYLLFTAPSILVDGYATEFCGFHSVLQMGDATGVFVIPVAFVGWGGRNCQFTNPVPGNRVVQGTMLILWHELEEIVTDPHFDAWFDIGGAEISDLCAWTTDEVVFEGDVVHNFRAANGNTYLLQALFVPDGTDTAAFPDGGLARTGYCGMRWPGKVPVEQTVRIENLTYGMQCLAATGGLGSRIVGRPCQAEEAQKFVLVRDGQGALSIKSLYSALPVGLWGGDLVSLAGGARTLWGISRPDSEGNVDFTPLIEHDTNLTMINGGAIQSRPVAPMGQQSWRIIPWN